MIDLTLTQSIYFIGAGGIGMSNLVRYFLALGKHVAGYDKTPTPLTDELIAEGAELHFKENVQLIPAWCGIDHRATTLVVRTPAVPQTHAELQFFAQNGYTIIKRAELLGLITRSSLGLCVAGTHGKTTTSSMLAHLLHQSTIGCNAFLGGILKNYNSNLILSSTSPYTVIEADEYDRSFHHLTPHAAIITSADPDHLEIYGTEEAYRESFAHFTSLIRPNGILIVKENLPIEIRADKSVQCYTYSGNSTGDFHADNIRIGNGNVVFDFVTPLSPTITNVSLGVPVRINIENAIAAMALAQVCGATSDEIKEAMATFSGAKRRFDIRLKQKDIVLIDDYGHHPEEVRASITSVKQLYPERKLTVIFQPHLYSRTAAFWQQFADALSLSDEVILLDIYPARETPIEGVTSHLIYEAIRCPKHYCRKEELMNVVEARTDFQVVLTLGAGDIDRFVEPIAKHIQTC